MSARTARRLEEAPNDPGPSRRLNHFPAVTRKERREDVLHLSVLRQLATDCSSFVGRLCRKTLSISALRRAADPITSKAAANTLRRVRGPLFQTNCVEYDPGISRGQFRICSPG